MLVNLTARAVDMRSAFRNMSKENVVMRSACTLDTEIGMCVPADQQRDRWGTSQFQIPNQPIFYCFVTESKFLPESISLAVLPNLLHGQMWPQDVLQSEPGSRTVMDSSQNGSLKAPTRCLAYSSSTSFSSLLSSVLPERLKNGLC